MPPPISPIEEGSHQDEYQISYQRAQSTGENSNATDDTSPSELAEHLDQTKAPNTVLDKLDLLPKVRQVPWRLDNGLPPSSAAKASKAYRGAVLLSTRGNVVPTPCTFCARGRGRFSQCIALDPWFQGACSTCVYNKHGHKCSLRLLASGRVGDRAPQTDSLNPNMYQTFHQSKESDLSNSIKKRKRQSEPATESFAPLYSKQNHDHHTSTSFDINSILQEAIAKEDFSGIEDHSRLLGKRHRRLSKRAMESTVTFKAQKTPANTAPTVHHPLQHNNKAMTAKPATVQHVNYIRQFVPVDEIHSSSTTSAHALSHRALNERSTPPIDTFPKAKQRQIYAVISGLQGNINHLQSELTSLKSLLGMELSDFDLVN